MDKIDISSYLTDYTITDKVPSTVLDFLVVEYVYMIAPSPQLFNWFMAHGWGASTYSFSDPSVITDYAIMQRVQFNETAVFQKMVTEFTNAYNEGRTLNDQRYDEILAVYTAMLDKTEDAMNLLETDEDTFESLVNAVISNLSTEYTTHDTEISGDLDDWGDSQRTRIETQFDNLLASKQSEMISRGLVSTTSWDAIEVGIERERADALTVLEDKIVEAQLNLDKYLYQAQVDIRMKFLDARSRLMDMLHKQGSVRNEIRNTIVNALSGFAERRTDEYPNFLDPLNSIANVAVSQKSGAWS